MEWAEAWEPIAEAGIAANLTAELARELSAGHPLYGIPVAAAALRQDTDDVLFHLLDGSDRLAVVHLTWGRGPELIPWPLAIFYDDQADWQMRGSAVGGDSADA